ncbi:MAG: hypothetical protein RL078_521 [Bacteroidota bacterium]|jgi:hypothetical protein
MKEPIKHFGFDPANYKWLYIGLAINILGFLLMIGGGSDDPKVFKEAELFSTLRITISPMLIVAGYVVIFYAIMKRNKKDNQDA